MPEYDRIEEKRADRTVIRYVPKTRVRCHPKASKVFSVPAVIVKSPDFVPYNDAAKSCNGTATFTEKRPHRSKTIGCHPNQADRMTDLARAEGITGVAYDRKTGELVSTSKRGLKAEAKRRGYHDENE